MSLPYSVSIIGGDNLFPKKCTHKSIILPIPVLHGSTMYAVCFTCVYI